MLLPAPDVHWGWRPSSHQIVRYWSDVKGCAWKKDYGDNTMEQAGSQDSRPIEGGVDCRARAGGRCDIRRRPGSTSVERDEDTA